MYFVPMTLEEIFANADKINERALSLLCPTLRKSLETAQAIADGTLNLAKESKMPIKGVSSRYFAPMTLEEIFANADEINRRALSMLHPTLRKSLEAAQAIVDGAQNVVKESKTSIKGQSPNSAV